MRKVLNLPQFVALEYKRHDTSLSDNSSFRNTTVWRSEKGNNGEFIRAYDFIPFCLILMLLHFFQTEILVVTPLMAPAAATLETSRPDIRVPLGDATTSATPSPVQTLVMTTRVGVADTMMIASKCLRSSRRP